MKLTVTVNNLPDNMEKYDYIVAYAYAIDGELWFYDGWTAQQKEDACKQAQEIHGILIKVEE